MRLRFHSSGPDQYAREHSAASQRVSRFNWSRAGHHLRVIESLEYTLTTQSDTAREKWVRKIKSHSQKRNTTSYDLAGGVSPTDLAQIMKDLPVLQEQVRAWLQEVHPELLTHAAK
jgi:hypothetical protein